MPRRIGEHDELQSIGLGLQAVMLICLLNKRVSRNASYFP